MLVYAVVVFKILTIISIGQSGVSLSPQNAQKWSQVNIFQHKQTKPLLSIWGANPNLRMTNNYNIVSLQHKRSTNDRYSFPTNMRLMGCQLYATLVCSSGNAAKINQRQMMLDCCILWWQMMFRCSDESWVCDTQVYGRTFCSWLYLNLDNTSENRIIVYLLPWRCFSFSHIHYLRALLYFLTAPFQSWFLKRLFPIFFTSSATLRTLLT